MIDQQLTGIAIAIGLLRHGGMHEAAFYLQQLMSQPADEATLQVFRQIVEECANLEELPAPRAMD